MQFKQLSFIVALVLSSNAFSKQIVHLPDDAGLSLSRANSCGLSKEGNVVWLLKGSKKQIDCFKKIQEKSLFDAGLTIKNQKLGLKNQANAPFKVDERAFYLAKKEFGLPTFLKKNPSFDGRGVVVGVIDDGASPHYSGLQKTSDGKRKYLGHFSNSSFYTYELKEVGTDPTTYGDYLSSFEQKFEKAFKGQIDEEKLPNTGAELDLNRDDKRGKIDLFVALIEGDKQRICIDVNVNKKVEKEECFGSFKLTGEYSFWDSKKRIPLLGEFDLEKKTLRVNEGEYTRDSHGEGVASVMVGHKIGGRFDGVAPGAQLLDYDLGEESDKYNERFYSIATFIRALEVLGEAKAEVVNISYSLYFMSVDSQDFMRKALEKLVEKYNFVITFSAGNNGPGLSSLNRRSIYPDSSLVVGAYVSKELDEAVHGATGLPEEGRVIYYSSRGPGPEAGRGPTVISPLASLTHRDTDGGFSAFSGTSSAAPAMGGFAAVLISALKQLELPIVAKTVTEAIRLSGKSLPGISFIDQGRGLPQIDKALAIYKNLVKGAQFESTILKARVRGVSKKGLLLMTSTAAKRQTVSISIESKLSKTLKPHEGIDLLKTLTIRYSHPWIDGAKRLWTSVSSSRFIAQVNIDAIDWEKYPEGEVLAQIDIIDNETGLYLQTFPITVVNDELLNKAKKVKIEVGAEEGKRVHFKADQNIKGIKIRTLIDDNQDERILMNIYDPSGVRIHRTWLDLGENTLQFNIPAPGHYQLSFARSKGTTENTKIDVRMSPIKLSSMTKMLQEYGVEQFIKINNEGENIEGRIILKKEPEVLFEALRFIVSNDNLGFDIETKEEGEYKFLMSPIESSKYSYFSYRCFLELKDKNEKIVKTTYGTSYIKKKKAESIEKEENEEEKKEPEIKKITAHCLPFDFISSDNSNPALQFLTKATFQSSKERSLSTDALKIKHGINSIQLKLPEGKEAEEGESLSKGNWNLFLTPAVSSGNTEKYTIPIGSLRKI